MVNVKYRRAGIEVFPVTSGERIVELIDQMVSTLFTKTFDHGFLQLVAPAARQAGDFALQTLQVVLAGGVAVKT